MYLLDFFVKAFENIEYSCLNNKKTCTQKDSLETKTKFDKSVDFFISMEFRENQNINTCHCK